MSLWSQSLSYCLYDYENDLESKAKCILSYLSMDIPRFWWEHALTENKFDSSYAGILNDLKKELLNMPESVGKIDSGMLVALAFADKEGMERRFDSVESQYSIKEYLAKAKEILIERPELGELGKLIDKTAGDNT